MVTGTVTSIFCFCCYCYYYYYLVISSEIIAVCWFSEYRSLTRHFLFIILLKTFELYGLVLSITAFYIGVCGPALRLSSSKLPCNLFAIIHIVKNTNGIVYYYYCCCFAVYINIYLKLWNFQHLYGKSYFTFQSVSVRLKCWVRDWKKCKDAM